MSKVQLYRELDSSFKNSRVEYSTYWRAINHVRSSKTQAKDRAGSKIRGEISHASGRAIGVRDRHDIIEKLGDYDLVIDVSRS